MKSENKKVLIISAVILVIAGFMVLLGINDSQKSKKVYEQFEAAYTSEKPVLVYIGKTSCDYCQLLEPSLKEMKERYGFDYLYINTDKFNSKYLNAIINKLGLDKVSTPYLTIIDKTGVKDKQVGYVDYDKLFEFLQKNNVINKEAKLLLNYINYEEYTKLIASEEPSIIVVGQSTCHYCVEVKLVLNQIAEESKGKINYLNIAYLTEEEAKKFPESFEYFQQENWGTPVTFVAQDGKMVSKYIDANGKKQDMLEGLVSKDQFINFFKGQGAL